MRKPQKKQNLKKCDCFCHSVSGIKLKINKLHLYAINEITTKIIFRNVKIFIEKQILIKITQYIIIKNFRNMTLRTKINTFLTKHTQLNIIPGDSFIIEYLLF